MVNETLDKKIAALQKEMPAVNFVGMEYAKAKAKHPKFPKRKKGGLAIIAEEFAELTTAFTKLCQGVNDKANNDNLKEEAAHVAVTAIRFIEGLEK